MTDVDRYFVLGQLVEAVARLGKSEDAYRLLPEIRSNLVMAIDNAASIQDVAGIPGRLTEVFGKITAAAYPAWGASKNTARILLAVQKFSRERRAVMEIRFRPELVAVIKQQGISIAQLNIGQGSTLQDLLEKCQLEGKLVDAFYTEGGFNREGAIIITGRDAVEVADLVIRIAGCYAQVIDGKAV